MVTAKKLLSGSWRYLAYSHAEQVLDPKTGKIKNKCVYESFTSNIPSVRGKREAKLAAAEFQLSKSKNSGKRTAEYKNMTLAEAIDQYIDSQSSILSPTTIQDYNCTKKYAFQDIMDVKLKDFDSVLLNEALNTEAGRKRRGRKSPISPKRLKNEWGLITAVLNTYRPGLEYKVTLPQSPERVPELLPAETVLKIAHGSDIELPVLLACWLSYTLSEIRGLTKSKSLRGDYLLIAETVVDVGDKHIRKELAKNATRNRMHRIPPYIKTLIDQVEGDIIVPMTGKSLYHKWIRLQKENGIKTPMTFHDLRHLNASVMALLHIPDKYAQERGGWKSDKIMKRVYMQTLSEERVKVDNMIDGYFDDLIHEKAEQKEEDDIQMEAFIKHLKRSDPDGWQNTIIKAMQHEMQHNKEKPL